MMVQTVRRAVWHHYYGTYKCVRLQPDALRWLYRCNKQGGTGGCQCERAHMPDNCRAVYLYSAWYFACIVTADCLYAVLG